MNSSPNLSRPRILTDMSALSAAQKRFASDPSFYEEAKKIYVRSDEMIEEPLLPHDDSRKRYFCDLYGRQLLRFSSVIGFAWLMSGQEKYAEFLKKALYHSLIPNTNWIEENYQEKHSLWHAELSTSMMTFAAAMCFDIIHDYLSEKERRELAEAIYSKGLQWLLNDWVLPESRVHALDSMGHNWWSVCIGRTGCALIALWEYIAEPEYRLHLITEAMLDFAKYNGAVLLNKSPNFYHDGVYSESIIYFDLGVGELLRFFMICDRFKGCKLKHHIPVETVNQWVHAYLYFSYRNTRFDSSILNFCGFGDGDYDSILSFFPQQALLFGTESSELLDNYQANRQEITATDLFYYDILCGEFQKKDTLPLEGVFPESGYVFLRDSWKEDASLLAIRCGYTWNHNHDDAGTFVIFDRGWPIICDSGKSPYASYEYEHYFKNAKAHNVILINPKRIMVEPIVPDVIYRGSKFPGKIADAYKNVYLHYYLADCTGPTARYMNRNYRTFLVFMNKYLVILDDLRANQKVHTAFALHYNGKATVNHPTEVDIQGQYSHMKVNFIFPQDLIIRKTKGLMTIMNRDCEVDNKRGFSIKDYITAHAKNRNEVQQYLTVFRLNDCIESSQVTPLQGQNTIGVEINEKEESYTILYNLLADGRNMHRNSNNQCGGYDTDAYMLIIQNCTGKKKSITMIYGSYLREKGESLFSSFYKTNTTIALA